jgi:hypothetical protein
MVAYGPLRRKTGKSKMMDLQLTGLLLREKKPSIRWKAVNQEHLRYEMGAKDRDIDRKQGEERNAAMVEDEERRLMM